MSWTRKSLGVVAKEVSDTLVEGQEDNLQQCGSAVQSELEPTGQAFMGVQFEFYLHLLTSPFQGASGMRRLTAGLSRQKIHHKIL